MSIYLLQLVGKWISVLLTLLVSLGPTRNFTVSEYTVNNIGNDMNLTVVANVVEFDTIYQYNSKLPTGVKNILTTGQDGIIYTDPATKNNKTLQEVVNEVVELGSGPQGNFIGTLTGYGPDCKGCSKTGTVSCKTREKVSHSLTNDGIYYKDITYGEVRILAAATTKFPCGTIVLVDNGIMDPFYGVVLDTGYTMRKAWNERTRVWMDLAFSSQGSVKNATSEYTKFTVQRWGW